MDGKYSTGKSTFVTTTSVASTVLNCTPAVSLSLINQNFSEINCSSDVEPVLFSNATAVSASYGPSTVLECVLMSIGIAGIVANGLMLIGRPVLRFTSCCLRLNYYCIVIRLRNWKE